MEEPLAVKGMRRAAAVSSPCKHLSQTGLWSHWLVPLTLHVAVQVSVVLFLNKCDILAEKIVTYDLAEHFPAYSGIPPPPLSPFLRAQTRSGM